MLQVVGTDSHTTMINGLGILGWGVGGKHHTFIHCKYFNVKCINLFEGIEAEAVILGAPISLVLPQVVGYRLTGEMNQYVTSTDVVLTITKVSCFIYLLLTIRILEEKEQKCVKAQLFSLFDKEGYKFQSKNSKGPIIYVNEWSVNPTMTDKKECKKGSMWPNPVVSK